MSAAPERPPRVDGQSTMPERLWSLNDLARFLRFEDPEVRYWAADRLGRHYTKEATDLLAPYLFDEHDLTPELVAAHLGKHGGAAHLPVLARGVKKLRGLPAAVRPAGFRGGGLVVHPRRPGRARGCAGPPGAPGLPEASGRLGRLAVHPGVGPAGDRAGGVPGAPARLDPIVAVEGGVGRGHRRGVPGPDGSSSSR